MIKNIQALRLLSCSCILLFHFGPHYLAMGGRDIIADICKNLYFGTDIFRVVSGFILMYITSTKDYTKNDAFPFLIKRFIRIFVSYYPFAILTFLVFYIFLPDYLEKINWISSLFLVSINLQELIIPVTWSLAFELYFYILFSIGLLFNLLHNRYLIYFLLAIVLIINILFPLAGVTHFILSPYLIEFMIGMLIYRYLNLCLKLPVYIWFSILMICLFLSIYYNLNQGLMRCVGFGLSGGVLLVILLSMEKNKSRVTPSLFVLFGSSSYIVFLSHYALIHLFVFLGINNYISQLPTLLIDLLSLIFIIFVFVFSLLYYKWVDLKLYSLIFKKIKGHIS